MYHCCMQRDGPVGLLFPQMTMAFITGTGVTKNTSTIFYLWQLPTACCLTAAGKPAGQGCTSLDNSVPGLT